MENPTATNDSIELEVMGSQLRIVKRGIKDRTNPLESSLPPLIYKLLEIALRRYGNQLTVYVKTRKGCGEVLVEELVTPTATLCLGSRFVVISTLEVTHIDWGTLI